MLHLLDFLPLLFQAFLLRECGEGARRLRACCGYVVPALRSIPWERDGLGLDVFGMEHEAL
jgi:hypothetical protein